MSGFDVQFSLSDTSDDENAVSVKDKASNERHTTSHGSMYMVIPFSYFITYFQFTTLSGML